MLPNFLIIGAMKSGTTSLHAQLRKHPQIFLPSWKEPGFFSHEDRWRKGPAWYGGLFAAGGGRAALGEASPSYTKYPVFKTTPERIYDLVPRVRLIYILRDPVDRIASHYLHAVHAGDEVLPPQRAILENMHYINTSRYFMQLERYLQYFPSDQILVLLLEDYQRDPGSTVRRIFEFLGVDADYAIPGLDERRNQSAYQYGRRSGLVKFLQKYPTYHRLSSHVPDQVKAWFRRVLNRPVMSPPSITLELRTRLISILQDDVLRLSGFLNRNLQAWLEPGRSSE